jgi:hypothetical protein
MLDRIHRLEDGSRVVAQELADEVLALEERGSPRRSEPSATKDQLAYWRTSPAGVSVSTT